MSHNIRDNSVRYFISTSNIK